MYTYFVIADESDAETVSNNRDALVAVEKLQGCFDELKQKLQTVNTTSDDTVATTSNPIYIASAKENFP